MLMAIALALTSGVLVGVNRQVNGTLAFFLSPLRASFINHLLGVGLLTLAGLAVGGLFTPTALSAPWYAYFGGPLGVLFVAGSSWLILRISAVSTTMLLISGQLLSGVALDIVRAVPGSPTARVTGIAMILAGVVLMHRRR